MANIVNLNSIRKRDNNDPDDNNQNDTNEYYVGGSDGRGGGSGLNVVEPGDRDNSSGNPDPYWEIFQSAYRQSSQSNALPIDSDNVVEITFYSNGFTVGDGPLREKGVVENDHFIKDIRNGVCPPELIRNGVASHVKPIDKRGETRKPPAFGGTGQTIGGQSGADPSNIFYPVKGAIAPVINEANPTIRLKLMFNGGKTKIVKLNKTHTLKDLTAIVDASGNVSGPYQLLTASSGSPKPITDVSMTMEAAELDGALVIVRII